VYVQTGVGVCEGFGGANAVDAGAMRTCRMTHCLVGCTWSHITRALASTLLYRRWSQWTAQLITALKEDGDTPHHTQQCKGHTHTHTPEREHVRAHVVEEEVRVGEGQPRRHAAVVATQEDQAQREGGTRRCHVRVDVVAWCVCVWWLEAHSMSDVVCLKRGCARSQTLMTVCSHITNKLNKCITRTAPPLS
jgi:hypothetical protein